MGALGRVVLSLALPALAAAVVFLAAGRWDLPWVWATVGVLAAFTAVGAVAIDPELLRERVRPGPGAVRDHHRRLALPLMLAHWVLAGLDLGRLHLSDTVPPAAQAVGLAGLAAALAVNLWAMRVNRFYSSVIRVQHDRGQVPISAGPYRWVRHPGYAATIACGLFGSLALGSWLALLPMLGFALLFLRRTATEDALLRRELPGYADYAARVRYRLVPGVW